MKAPSNPSYSKNTRVRFIVAFAAIAIAAGLLTATAYMQKPGGRQVDDLGDRARINDALIDRSDNPFPVEQKFDADGNKIEMSTEGQPAPASVDLITAGTYAFTSSSGVALEDMSSGTTTLLSNNMDDNASGLTAIPFDFWLDGVRANQFSVNGNGEMRLGNTVIATTFTNSLATTTDAPKLAPYWDDLWIGFNGKVHFKVVGSAPARKLVVEWQNMQVPRVANGSTGAATFQAWLYESTGVIEYVYGSGMAANATNSGYSVGIQSGVATNFVSVTTATNTASYVTANDTNTGAITAGTKYTFTPVAPTAPTGLSFTGVTGTSETLNWTDTSSNEVGFLIYRSTDGVNYTFITQTAANAITSTQGNLGNNQTYFWRVIAVSEGAVSTTLSGSQATTTGTVSGTKSVGPTGIYASLTAAFTDITTNGLAGNVILELQPTYLSAVETFPIVPSVVGSPSATITIRPETGATGLSILGTNTTAIFDLSGSSFVTIDGRPGGTGATRDMTISNTGTGSTIRFINGASSNTLKFLQIRSVNTSATTGGDIFFSTTTAVTGNNNNTIDNNDIRDGATAPVNGIASTGTTTLGLENNNNTVSNNSIFNFFSATADHNGIILAAGNTNWTISGNSFYNTNGPLNITTTSVVWNGIRFSSATGNWGHNVTGNFIGGTAVSAGGGALTFIGAGVIRATQLTTGSQIPTSLQGNTIGNFNLTTSSGSTSQSGLGMVTGAFNAGDVTPNTITNWTINDTGAATLWRGISGGTGTPAVVVVANNIVSNITNASTSLAQVQGIGLQGTYPAVTVTGNTVGSTSVANSISMSAAAVSFFGIVNSGTSTTTANYTNNTVANVTSTGTGAFNMVGMSISGGGYSITGNTIRNLTTASTGTASTIVGINATATSSINQVVSQNTIRSCNSTAPAAGVVLFGIIYSGPTTGASVVSRNFVHSIAASTTSTTAEIDGLRISAGNATFQNNMIRLGFFDDGTPTSITTGLTIGGIVETGGTNSIYHNTVYIGGTGVASASNTSAFISTLTSGTRAVRDNILANNRQNASGTATNTGTLFFTALTLPSPTGLTMSNNTYFSFDPAATVRNGSAGTSYSVAGWQGASAQDGNSFYATLAQINFVNANGTSSHASPQAVLDLHVASPTAIEGAGVDVGVVDDFDGQTRASLTPVDVGADAGSFTGVDLAPPAISYAALVNTTSTSNRSLTGVTITDGSGVNTTAGTKPRLYYKKSTDTNDLAATGWKFVEANGSSSPFDFTIDYALLNAGSVSAGDTIQYFVVAQDLAATPNVAINSGTFAAPPSSVALTGTAFPIIGTINSYLISIAYAGSYNVGTSETITSLTNTGGLFQAINNGVLSGDVTINITSDLIVETGTFALNQWTEQGVGNYTLSIRPSGAAARLVSGTNTLGLINLSGADRVTIDGLNTGGNALTIRNTDTAGATIRFITDASNNTIQNCTIEGATTSTTTGVIFIDGGTASSTTGNDNNTITNNTIRDRSDAAGVPANLIRSDGFSATVINSNNVISNNTLKNFTSTGIMTTSPATENWTISNNTIFQEAARTTALTGISFGAVGTTNTITQNTIRDLNTTSSATGVGVNIALATTVSRNRIFNFPSSGTTLTGITFTGTSTVAAAVTVVNNMVSIVPSGSTSQTIFGIRDFAFTGNTFNAYFNTVLIGGIATGSTTWACQRGFATPTAATWNNNICFNNRTGGAVNHFAMGEQSLGSGTFTSNFNLFVGTGTTAANFMDRGTSSSGTAMSMAAWQATAGTPDLSSQASNPGVGSFTTTAMFVLDPDLHSLTTSPALSAGTTVGSVTADFDNDPRPASNPDVGADELVQAVAGSIPAGTYYNASAADGDTLGGNVTITNIQYLNGKLSTGTNTLTLDCFASISGASPTSFVIGNLKKNYCGTGVKGFEVGTANGYSPVSVTVTAGTFPADFTVKAVQGPHSSVSAATSLQRYWTLTEGGDITANLQFNYLDPTDIMGTEANYRLIRVIGGAPRSFANECPIPTGNNACVNPGTDQATINGVTGFSDWTLGEPVAPTAAPGTISGRVTTPDGNPLGGVTVFLSGNASTRTITNGDGRYGFDNVPTEAFYTVTPALVNYSFSPSSRSFSLMGNQTDVGFTANATAPTGNPLNVVDYFVRQQYLDFLGREPDMGGWLYWTSQISACGNNQMCINQKRIDVSAAFFASEEFQQTGSFIYRLYQTGLGRQLSYGEFTADRPRVLAGPDLEENRAAFALEFVTRPEFTVKYQHATTADRFVDSLLATVLQSSGLDLSAQREALLAEYSQGADLNHSRSRVLRTLADNSAITDAAYNPSFVLMEYFGYLRRDIDQGGYEYWLDVLNHGAAGNYRGMVCAFLTSTEYQLRFSPIVTHSNAECGP